MDYNDGDAGSDYGSDFDSESEQQLSDLLAQISVPGVEDGGNQPTRAETGVPRRGVPFVDAEVELPQSTPREDTPIEGGDSVAQGSYGKSPLARFRTAPRKPLSVTDMVSPSWCELQYWYVLTKHGRKRRTAAMRRGSAVHKTLEEEVQRTVPVSVDTTEDAWGLRVWNVVQSLRSLRETGLAREMEVWGVVDGQVINGVIDELSYVCPDKELEQQRPETQGPMDVYVGDQTKTNRLVYIADIKTRNSHSLPRGASFRPTLMQLMLYYRLLADMAARRLDFGVIYARYGLDPHARFSDGLIEQVRALDAQEPSGGDVATNTLVQNRTLHELVTNVLLGYVIPLTFPRGEDSLSRVLQAQYRTPGNPKSTPKPTPTPANSTSANEAGEDEYEILGAKTFVHNAEVLDNYLRDELDWWCGRREPVGVPVEEAYKCRICEFASECTWRLERARER